MSDFLDELVSDEQYNDNVDQGLMGRIEGLIWHSSLNDIDKAKQMRKMLKLESMEDAYKMVKFLSDFQPILATERTAITQYEIVQATRERADREDFKERKK